MKRTLLTLALAGAALTAACGDDNTAPTGEARLRVVHGSPDAPPVDVVIDGDTVLTNIPYLGASDYLDQPAGVRTVRVSATGTSDLVIDVDLNLADGTDYTMIVGGLLAQIDPILLIDDTGPPPAGKARVRAVHASPGAKRVDVYVTTPDEELTNATPVLTDVAFGESTQYIEADAGSYRVRVTPTGKPDVLIDSGTLTLETGQVRTAIAVDAKGGGPPFDLRVLPDRN